MSSAQREATYVTNMLPRIIISIPPVNKGGEWAIQWCFETYRIDGSLWGP
jgi:hypothetical protein